LKQLLINAEPLDKQYAGIHYYLKLLRKGLELHFPEWPVYYLREKHVPGSACDIQLRPRTSLARDPFKHFWAIPHFVKNFRPDSYLELTHFGPFNISPSVQRITVIHDLTPVFYPHYHPLISSITQRIFLKHTMRNASVIIANSRNTFNDIITFIPEVAGKVRVVYPAVEPLFKPVTNRKALAGYGIDGPYILSLSTLEPRKNLAGLLIAYQKFREKSKSDIKLVLVGRKGWKNERFNSLLKNHKFRADIIITGYVDRKMLPVLYSNAELFVFPSFYEGFGFPVLEAISCGVPCAVSGVSSLPEVAGEGALYFNPDNHEEMAEIMKRIIYSNQLRDEMRAKALEQAERFSLKLFAEGILNEVEG